MLLGLFSLIVIFIDQILKYMVVNKVIDVVYIFNTGIAFGFFQNYNKVFLLFLPLFIVFIIFMYSKNNIGLVSSALICGGGISNYIDRLRLGGVVDFIYIKGFSVFNIADVAIVIGVILFFINYLFLDKRSINNG